MQEAVVMSVDRHATFPLHVSVNLLVYTPTTPHRKADHSKLSLHGSPSSSLTASPHGSPGSSTGSPHGSPNSTLETPSGTPGSERHLSDNDNEADASLNLEPPANHQPQQQLQNADNNEQHEDPLLPLLIAQ